MLNKSQSLFSIVFFYAMYTYLGEDLLFSSPLQSKGGLLESPRRPRYVLVLLYSETVQGISTKLGRIVYGNNPTILN